MYTINVWNEKSTNFDVNEFVRIHGTDELSLPARDEAVVTICRFMKDENIKMLTMNGPEGTLSWTRRSEEMSKYEEFDNDEETL